MKWSIEINDSDLCNPEITVNTPADAFVGRYKAAIYLESEIDGKVEVAIDQEPDIILICNPWCEQDTVYMSSQEERQEYVLNDTGNMNKNITKYMYIIERSCPVRHDYLRIDLERNNKIKSSVQLELWSI